MLEALKAAGMYALTAIITAIATRYHLTGEQQAALTADVAALAAAASGVILHYIAYQKEPPK